MSHKKEPLRSQLHAMLPMRNPMVRHLDYEGGRLLHEDSIATP